MLAAVEALMLSCPAAACEALLGWWNPTSAENQAKIREAQEQEAYHSEADQENGDLDGEDYEVEQLFSLIRPSSTPMLQASHTHDETRLVCVHSM